MLYKRILAKILQMRWAITPEALRGIRKAVEEGLTKEDYDLFHALSEAQRSALVANLGEPLAEGSDSYIRKNAGFIFIDGPIVPRADFFSDMSGLTSIESLKNDFFTLQEDRRVDNIVLIVDSPGGDIVGISDFAELVRNSKKNTVSFTYGMSASAGYWISSAAHRSYSSPTGILGSIGVRGSFRVPQENDRIVEMVSTQSPSKVKDPREEGAQAIFQAELDDLAAVFLGDVAGYRGTTPERVAEEFGQGATMAAMPALERGMFDEIATFDDVVSELLSKKVAAQVEQSPFVVQTLIFSKEVFPQQEQAVKWASDHEFRSDKVDPTENTWRLRQEEPNKFRRLRTLELGAGILAVGGPLKETTAAQVATSPAVRAVPKRVNGTAAKARHEASIANAKKVIDRYRAKIARNDTEKREDRKPPAIAGNPGQGALRTMDPILAELAASDPAIAAAIKKETDSAFAKGKKAGDQEAKSRIEAATPYLEDNAPYGPQVRKVAMGVLAGKFKADTLVATVAAVDAVKESQASDEAAGESDATGDTPPTPPKTQGQSAAGFMNEAEFDAEVARVRKQRGMEV